MDPQNPLHRSLLQFALAISLSLALGLSSCFPASGESPERTNATQPSPGWLDIYFTDPGAPNAEDFEGGPDEKLAAAIDAARLSVDIAAYSLNLWSIRDALIHAHQRGVDVRMVMESDNMDSREVEQLQEAGVPIIGDQREGLMHHKFVVLDQAEVWTGSMNFTINGAYLDDNNLIRIRSTDVAEDFTVEFNEMFEQNRFGPDEGFPTPTQTLKIDGTLVEVYFSPDDGVAKRIQELINGANESIYFLAYSFTSNELADALVAKRRAGLKIAGVMDDDAIATNLGTEYDHFLQVGLDVRRDGNEGLMHHKVMLIDKKIVITGSYNFTASAEDHNDENVVILHSDWIASRYLDEFQRIYDQAQP